MPERVRFRYQMDGGGWSPLAAQRMAVFEWLSPGRHSFQVVGFGADGAWNKQGATLEIFIEPQFWQSGWFAACIALVSAAGAALVMRWVQQRRYLRRMADLEHQKDMYEERARIARDLHDEIGSKLSRLSFLGALIQRAHSSDDGTVRGRAADMVSTARSTLRAFENVVWAVSPRNDSLKSLANHICQHAEEFFAGSPVICRFKVDDLLPDWPIEPKVRNELFLAVKEALNNTLKHSQATGVEFAVAVRGRRLEMKVVDNGCGFDVGGVKVGLAGDAHGNGLRHMRGRLEAVGGLCIIESTPGQGTRVILEMEVQ